jgi:hypothetical protein
MSLNKATMSEGHMHGRVLWIAVLTWIFLECTFAFPCKADDAEDAVEILTLSLNCPHKPDVQELVRSKVDGERRTMISHTISKYLGDAHRLVVEEQTTYDKGDKHKFTVRASFANLDAKGTGFNPATNAVLIGCLHNLDCLTWQSDNGKPAKTNMSGFEVCNQETAERVKFGIETLIKLNQESPAPAVQSKRQLRLNHLRHKVVRQAQTLIRNDIAD